jgi:hypothetical protein
LLQRVATAKAQSNNYEPGFRAMREPGLFFAQLSPTLRNQLIAFPQGFRRLIGRYNRHIQCDQTDTTPSSDVSKGYQLNGQQLD